MITLIDRASLFKVRDSQYSIVNPNKINRMLLSGSVVKIYTTDIEKLWSRQLMEQVYVKFIYSIANPNKINRMSAAPWYFPIS